MHVSRFVFCLLLFFALLSCDPFLYEEKPVRVVRCKIAVCPRFAARQTWRDNAARLIDAADATFRSWAEVGLEIDTMVVVDLSVSGCYTGHYISDCMIREIPKDGSDIVIYFSKDRRPETPYLGLSKFEFGYAHVIQADWDQKNRDYLFAFHTLIHELGHMFGAVHVYTDQNDRKVMNPMVDHHLVRKVGTDWKYTKPEFHRGNMEIMLACAHRGFSRNQWWEKAWQNIRGAYDCIPQEYNKYYESHGLLKNTAFNEFVEGDRFHFLATWASLAGHRGQALAYLDSLQNFYDCVQRTCRRESGAISTICSRFGGHGKTAVDEVHAVNTAFVDLQRSYAFLRAGMRSQADSCYKEFADGLPTGFNSVQRGKLSNQYMLYNDIYLSSPAHDEIIIDATR